MTPLIADVPIDLAIDLDILDDIAESLEPFMPGLLAALALLLTAVVIIDIRRRIVFSPVDRILRRRRL